MKQVCKISFLMMLFFAADLIANEDQKKNIMIVGHRGAAAHAPENTIAAIELAIELGANTIEIDLRQTKDGVPVALHDSGVDRTTDGDGDISDLTFEDIRKLDAGSWFDEKYSGEKIPSLQEVIDALSDTTILIIEFKGGLGEYDKIEERTIQIVQDSDISDRVILKSFDPNQLELIQELDDSFPLLYVYALRIPWLHMIIDTGITFGSVYDFDVEYLQPHIWFLSESFVEDAQEKGYKIIAWGVNDPDTIIDAINIGVDGIETDYPERVYKILNE